MTLFDTLDITTTRTDVPTIAQPALNHSLALVPSHWERGGAIACRGMNYAYRVDWYLVFEDGSWLPYSEVGKARWEERTGLVLAIR